MTTIQLYGHPQPTTFDPATRVLTANGWQVAATLTTDDWLVFSIPQGETSAEALQALIPPPPASRAKRTPRVTGVGGRVTKEDLAALLDRGLTYSQIAEHYGFKSKQAIQEYVSCYGLNRPAGNVLTGNPTADPDFWRVVGYWLAEGDITGGRKGDTGVVRFAFGWSEQVLVDDVRAVLRRYGIDVHQHEQSRALLARCSSIQLAGFLSLFGLGVYGKSLPDWAILLPVPFAQELIRGYLEGDGCIEADRGWARITSVSLPLLEGVRQLLLRLGVAASIMAGVEKYEIRFPVMQAPWLGVTTRPVTPKTLYIKDSRAFVKIKSIG